MDLREQTDGPRHPWEKNRAAFFSDLLATVLDPAEKPSVLDCGAGDAFFSAQLRERFSLRSVTCWDASYDAPTIDRLARRYATREPRLSFTKTRPQGRFDLVLMLDVIEHVEDDGGFVRSIVEDCLEPEKGLVVVSVPAWPVLFTRHDELLLHHRRYVPKACDEVLEAAGLELVERGGAFHSLLLPRVLEVFRDRIERVVGRSDRSVRSAAATWGGGAMVTAAVEALLRADSAVSKLASQCGANVPGLSYWALARKRRRS